MKIVLRNKVRDKMENARTCTLLKGNWEIKEIKIISG